MGRLSGVPTSEVYLEIQVLNTAVNPRQDVLKEIQMGLSVPVIMLTAKGASCVWSIVMTNKEHFRRLEQMYATASCNEYYSPELTVSMGAAELVIPVQEKFFHAAGATHGAVYFKALDDAAFFACNSVVKDFLVLTVNFNVYLIRPISSGHMRAVGRIIHDSRNLMIAESELFDSKGREIARGSGTFAKSKIRLSPDLGYELP